jgi:hypothetical protein
MIVLRVCDCKTVQSSDVVFEEEDVVLRCFKCWMMCHDHGDNEDIRCVAKSGGSA